MTSVFGYEFVEAILYIAGNPDQFLPAINVPFILSVVFLMVLVFDVCHLIGVLIHG